MASADDLLPLVSTTPEEPATIWYIGQHESQRTQPTTSRTLSRAQEAGYDILTTPITTSHFQSRVLTVLQRYIDELSSVSSAATVPMPLVSPLNPQDTDLTPEDTNSAFIASTSPWIDLGSPDPIIAHVSRQVFNQEIAYAAFCGISNVLVRGPISKGGVTQYARTITEALGTGPYLQLHIPVPMVGELESDGSETTNLAELVRPQYHHIEDEDEQEDLYGSWDVWNSVRTMLFISSLDLPDALAFPSHFRLLNSLLSDLSGGPGLDADGGKMEGLLALELPRQIPSQPLQSRWYSEPLRLLFLPRTSFLRNAKGYPVLSKPHQSLLTRYTRLRMPPWIILTDVGPIPGLDESTNTGSSAEPTPAESAAKAREKPKDPTPHLRYLRHLQQNQPARPPIERFGAGYQDYLQSPLQPLTDNLESITYEVFEKDPVKYEWYERAIAAALKDIRQRKDDASDNEAVVVAVVGAGRGPLVTRALRASRGTAINITAWAVEKNPNAHVLLQRRNTTDPLWNNQVSVVKSDMRSWQGPVLSGKVSKVDILVSELLGSFADNELSPECLDGVQHVLHPSHGTSIPSSYTAHFTPISTPKIYSDLLTRPGHEKWDVPYVVMLHQYDDLALESGSEEQQVPAVQQAWAFSHPAPVVVLQQAKARAGGGSEAGGAGGAVGGDGSNEHNARFCKLRFRCHRRGVCHGLGGYFETVLYSGSEGKVELSTNPVTMEQKSRDMISWFPIFFPLKTPLFIPDDAELEVSMWRQTDDRKVWYEWLVEVYQQQKGRRTTLGMSELHSSRKNGCLM